MSRHRREERDKHAVMYYCQLCGNPHQMGPHRYEGQFLPHYQMQVCSGCLRGHWDGVSPAFELTLTAHLNKHGIALPKRNEKGLYPLEAWASRRDHDQA
jgi:hypothetical protein